MSEFSDALKRLLGERGMSVRECARRVPCDSGYVSKLASGGKRPSPQMAERFDRVLGAAGALAALAAGDGELWPGDGGRLAWVAGNPRRAGLAEADSLAGVLAAQRRAEDSLGSAAVLPSVAAQLQDVEALVSEARGPARAALVDVAGQWAQFTGWLNASLGHLPQASRLYDTTLALAAEAGNRNLAATALNMKGWIAWMERKPGPMIGLSQAAQRDRAASPGVRALAAQQEARGHAIMGDSAATDRKLGEAHELTLTAAERPDDEPPWVYFYGPAYLQLQRGRACLYLGRYAAAAELLAGGLTALPAAVHRSEWAAHYLADLAAAWRALGDVAECERIAEEVAGIAAGTGSIRLARRAAALR